jgi:adenylate cyclase
MRYFARNEIVNTSIAYIVTLILLVLYNGNTSAFLHRIGMLTLLMEYSFVGILGYIIKTGLIHWYTGTNHDKPVLFQKNLPRCFLSLEASIWMTIGIVISTYHIMIYGQEALTSALIVMIGTSYAALYNGAYLFLRGEYFFYKNVLQRKYPTSFHSDKIYSTISRVFLFSGSSIIFLLLILSLLVSKDLDLLYNKWITLTPPSLTPIFDDINMGYVKILVAFSFFAAITYMLLKQYDNNIRLKYKYQISTLRAIESGLPISVLDTFSNDEFGLVAKEISNLAKGLEEKAFIRSSLGKYLSPEIAGHILHEEHGLNLGGSEVNATVMFTDIRNYAAIAERLKAQNLVTTLNEYFSFLVKIIHQNGGVIDKFIGDSTMAIFGLEDSLSGCNRAVQASMEIQSFLREFNRKMRESNIPEFRTGIGIHYGTSVAGNIGSLDRLEYTIIGDVVNIASRLEDITKQEKRPIIISNDVYNLISSEHKEAFIDLGEHKIRGKETTVSLYGVRGNIAYWPE